MITTKGNQLREASCPKSPPITNPDKINIIKIHIFFSLVAIFFSFSNSIFSFGFYFLSIIYAYGIFFKDIVVIFLFFSCVFLFFLFFLCYSISTILILYSYNIKSYKKNVTKNCFFSRHFICSIIGLEEVFRR